MPAVETLTPGQLAARLGQGEPLLLLDVREPSERALCTIAVPPTARQLAVPMNAVPAGIEALRGEVGALPVVVYCHHGVRSWAVAEWLATQGFAHLFNLEGGIHAWAEEVDPTLARY